MRLILAKLTAATMLLAGTAALATEQPAPSTLPSESGKSPGIQMQEESPPGASEYTPGRQTENVPGQSRPAPGQKMQDETGAGASQHAPDQLESGSSSGASKY